MKFVIGICDDLEEDRARLAAIIQDYCRQQGIRCRILLFASGDELLENYRPGQFHILFLDIYMPGISGVETAHQIRRSDTLCSIVFVTTSQEHGMDSYDVQASDYLVKPFTAADVENAMSLCVTNVLEHHRTLDVQTGSGLRQVPLRDLRYIEIQGHTACLHIGSEVLTVRRGMDELEREINHADFLRCHRSYLVNMNYISLVDKNSFHLLDGDDIPIGSTGISKVKDQYMTWSFLRSWERRGIIFEG